MLALYLALVASFGAVEGARDATLRSDEYARGMRRGIAHLYRLEHDEAIRFFGELEREFPAHPGPPLARAMATWLRELFSREELDLGRFISPGYFTRPADEEMDEADRRRFFEDVSRARELADRHLASFPGDVDARYYLGACEAALGVFAYTIDRSYLAALRRSKTAYEIQRAIVEEEPDFGDSYLTVGTYEYVVGNLPWYVKWIAALAGFRGSEARGFEYLVRSVEKGLLVQDEARVLLMVLYVREGRHDYALEIARDLHARFPENFLLHLNRVQILERMGRAREAAEELEEVVRRAEAETPHYEKVVLGRIRYPFGARLLDLGRDDEALAQFRAAIESPEAPEEHRALSHLRTGEILEARGAREEAVEHFREVRKLEDVDGSHRAAERYLREP